MSEATWERIAKAVEEQLKWTRLVGMNQLKSILEQTLRTDEDRLVYQLSNGEMSTRDIEKLVGVSRSKIASLWNKWYRMGLMERSTKYEGKRMQRTFSLEDVGMEIPSLPAPQSTVQREEEEFQ